MVEIRKVPGFPGYGASRDGRVWSKKVLGKNRVGRRWRPLKPQNSRGGYKHVTLSRDAKKIIFTVHLVIMRTFVGPLPEGMETRHLNGIPDDNRLENLCYGTQSENNLDRTRHGTAPRGESHGRSVLTEDQANEIIGISAREGTPNTELGRMYGVSDATISMLLSGKTWTHLERPKVWAAKQKQILTPSAKLTEDQVMKIKVKHDKGYLQRELAKEFGVTPTVISNIMRGHSWSHITGIKPKELNHAN
jgi:predicted RNA-binding protein YlxR (DUF448 family)